MKTLYIFLLIFLTVNLFGNTRGLKIISKDNESIEMPYEKSFALLVGVSDYTNGWPDLESIPSELKKVEKALTGQGFKVRTVLNPKGDELFNTFENFVNKYGYHEENRLFFLFSGHGYTTNGGKKGYLVPADAPNPNVDERAFKRSAMNMGRLITLSREMESKHALFLFDSCFSGTIFKTRALPKQPPYIKRSMSKPVRQFITAGSANEEVPSSSTFTPMFIDAIEGEADLNDDHYITGSELGMYMSQNLPNYANQSPQYGKIKDYELSQGDFIFIPNKPILSEFTLNIRVLPTDAEITLLNNRSNFRQGMQLKKGTYTIKAEKEGYISQELNVELSQNTTVDIQLTKEQFTLDIKTVPSMARISITDQNEHSYTPGMKLDAGNYRVKISKEGYVTQDKSIYIDKDTYLKYYLEEIQVQPVQFDLFIVTNPADAYIKLIGTKEYTYYHGIRLDKGAYIIMISKNGYETLRDSIYISGTTNLSYSLEKTYVEEVVQETSEPEKKKKKIFFGF